MFGGIILSIIFFIGVNTQELLETAYFNGNIESSYKQNLEDLKQKNEINKAYLSPILNPLIDLSTKFTQQVSHTYFKDYSNFFFYLSLLTPAADLSNTQFKSGQLVQDALLEQAALFRAPFKTKQELSKILNDLKEQQTKYPSLNNAPKETSKIKSLYENSFALFLRIGQDYFIQIMKNDVYKKDMTIYFNTSADNIFNLFKNASDLLINVLFLAKSIEVEFNKDNTPPQLIAATELPYMSTLQDIIITTPELLNSQAFPIVTKLAELAAKMTESTLGKTTKENGEFFLYLYLLSKYILLPPESLFHNQRIRNIILYYSEEMKQPHNLGQAIGDVCLHDYNYYILFDPAKNRKAELEALQELESLNLLNYEETTHIAKAAYHNIFILFSRLAADYFKKLSADEEWIQQSADIYEMSPLKLRRHYEFSSFVLLQVPYVVRGKYNSNTVKELLCKLVAVDIVDSKNGRYTSSTNYYDLIKNLKSITGNGKIHSIWGAYLILAVTGFIYFF